MQNISSPVKRNTVIFSYVMPLHCTETDLLAPIWGLAKVVVYSPLQCMLTNLLTLVKLHHRDLLLFTSY